MKTVTKLFKAGTALCAVAVLSLTASSAQANQVIDGGFEVGPLTFDGPPFVGTWEGFSGSANASANISSTDPLSGAQHLDLIIAGDANSFTGVFQDLPSQIPGQAATFSGWSKDVGVDAGGSEIRIEWRDSVNNAEISRTANLVPTLNANGYTYWEVNDVVPAGADTARIVYAIQSFGAGPNQQIYVDDLSYVPEPASMALLGLGGLALMRRR